MQSKKIRPYTLNEKLTGSKDKRGREPFKQFPVIFSSARVWTRKKCNNKNSYNFGTIIPKEHFQFCHKKILN